MDEQPNANSRGIKVDDALDLYFTEAEFPDSICEELRKRIIDGVKNNTEQGGGIMLSNYGLEVYESGSEYYVEAAAFNYVMEQIRLKGESSYRCGQQSEIEEGSEEDKK